MNKNYLVIKSNYFIMNSSYDLSLEEQKIILTLASMVQPEDIEFKPYKFKIADFIELLGIETQTKYVEIPKITKDLMKKVFEIKEDKSTLQVAWLSSVRYEKGSGEVTLCFDPNLKPYMLQLKEKFTQYQLANILSMKSKYSPRIYEILKCNEFKKQGYIEIEIKELKKLLKAETIYPLYGDFKRRILQQSQKELKNLSDISFEFVEIKTGRAITALKFYIHRNTVKKTPTIDKPMPGQIDMTEVLNSEGAATDEEATDNMITEKELIELKAIFTKHDLTNQAICSIYEDSKKDMDLVRVCYLNCLNSEKKIENVVGYMRSLVKTYEPPQKQSAVKSKNKFLSFPQTKYNFDEIERIQDERMIAKMKKEGIIND